MAVSTSEPIPPGGFNSENPGKGSIIVVDLADGISRSISGDRPNGDLAFARDGTQVAYYGAARNALVVAPVNGAGDRTFQPVSYSTDVVWSLDNQSVVSGSNPIVRVDLATGVVAPLRPEATGPLLPTQDRTVRGFGRPNTVSESGT